MSYRLIVHPQAEEEIFNSADWYDLQREGLGNRFKLAVVDAMDSILDNPEIGSIVRGSYRQFVIPVFPFIITYKIMDTKKHIRIHSIFHTKRNPKNRIKKF